MRSNPIKIGSLAVMVAFVGWMVVGNPFRLFAQATTGYSKIGSVNVGTNTFTTTTLTDGAAYNFEVTAANSAGESLPSNIVTAVIPAAGTHTVTLSWTPATTGDPATSFNIYDKVVSIPNQPGALTVVVN
jgi:hypothetical protein